MPNNNTQHSASIGNTDTGYSVSKYSKEQMARGGRIAAAKVKAKTAQKIKLAICQLQVENQKITSTSICKKAGISRPTLYNHFGTIKSVKDRFIPPQESVKPSSQSVKPAYNSSPESVKPASDTNPHLLRKVSNPPSTNQKVSNPAIEKCKTRPQSVKPAPSPVAESVKPANSVYNNINKQDSNLVNIVNNTKQDSHLKTHDLINKTA